MTSINPYAFVATLLLVGAAVAALVLLSAQNKLLFRALLVALGVHAGIFGYLGLRYYLNLLNPPPKEIRLQVSVKREAPPPPPPKAEVPKPQEKPRPRLELPKPAPPKPAPPKPIKPAELPKGLPNQKTKAKVMPKGTKLKPVKPRAPGEKPRLNPNPQPRVAQNAPPPKRGRTLTGPLTDDGIMPSDDKASLFDPLDGSLDAGEIRGGRFADKGKPTGNRDGRGDGGESAGDPDGTGSGPIPAGFAEGKANGKVYFIRLKHGRGAWNAFSSGTRRLMAFMDAAAFPSERDARALTADEMRSKYMKRGVQPTFLYLYCDESFSLNSNEVSVLRQYMADGGFLFLDSRPDPDIRKQVAEQLNKVLPGTRLAALSNSHPVNSFVYRLSSPGVGENFIERKNYGISQRGKLVVFYTMGNFSHFFSVSTPESAEYSRAQYQMATNVLVYAMKKGSPSGIGKRQGASAKVTTQQLEKMGLLDAPSKPKLVPGATPTSVKVKPTPLPGVPPATAPVVPEEPDEIKLLD